MTKRVKRVRLIADHADDGRTLQSEAAKTDINNVLAHYRKTGTFTHVSTMMPSYGDFSETGTYLEAMTKITEVERTFMECSAEVRAVFDNDPAQMLEFLSDPENRQEAEQLGLAEPTKWPKEAVTDTVTPEAETQAELPLDTPSPVQGGD